MAADMNTNQMMEAQMQAMAMDPNGGQPGSAMTQAQYQQLVNQLGAPQYSQPGAGQPQMYYGQGQAMYAQPGYGNEDPYAAYAMAMQQQAGYGMQQPGGMFAGGGLPGPSYHDPYGMLNPAACVAPLGTQVVGPNGGPQVGAKNRKKKQAAGLCGCC